jgi:hypothetical protein
MTDYGSYQRNDGQLSQLEHAVETEARNGLFQRGVTVIVFVHGWDNNAQENNRNLRNFRSLLARAAGGEKRDGRGVLGVYLSWRGKSLAKPLKAFTYWGRGRAAETIGQGIMVEVLARIRNIHWLVAEGARSRGRSRQGIYQNSRLVLIGHSFGGRALYNAVAAGMETNFLQPYWAARSFPQAQGRRAMQIQMRRASGFGDLVLLINPAIKSLPYRKIDYAMRSNTTVNYDPKQPVLMMVLSATNDTPNKSYLPVGEMFGNRFRDVTAPQSARTEAKQNVTALGHFQRFHSHRLVERNGRVELQRVPEFFTYRGLPVKTLRSRLMQLDGVITDPEPGLLPYMMVSVDPKIINGHSGFWPDKNPLAYQFVESFISAQNRAVGAARKDQGPMSEAGVVPAGLPAPSQRAAPPPPVSTESRDD